MAPRKGISLAVKLAAALLRIRKDDGAWLIPEPHRSSGTAEEICRCVEWDHGVLHAHGGSDAPQNLYPMLVAEHREKSRFDTGKAAKSRRISAAEEAFRARMLARITGTDDEGQEKAQRRAQIKSRGFDKTRSRKMNGQVVER